MDALSRRQLFGIAAVTPLVGALANARAAAFDVEVSPRETIRQRYFPNVLLQTHEGRTVRFYDDLIKDKVVMINFMYTRCADGQCPLITANLVRVQKLMNSGAWRNCNCTSPGPSLVVTGRDIFMYSITLQPKHDTPAVLKKYARSYGVGPGWTFLTGKPVEIELLRRSLGFTDPDPRRDANKANHIGNVRYGNEPLHLWAACPGMAHADWIAESISWVIRRESPAVVSGAGKQHS
jgi:protein SCO1/2